MTKTNLRPVARSTLAVEIRRSLQAYIAEHRLTSGERLPSERDLAEALAVGRPVLREAMRELAALGILEMRHGSGAYVASPQHPALTSLLQLGSAERLRMLRQASEARALIEVEIAGRAAALDPTVLAATLALLDEPGRESDAERRRHRLDFTFEQRLSAAVGDPYLIELQRHAQRLFAEAWEACGVIPRPHEERHAQHLGICQALLAGHAGKARQQMQRHLEIDARVVAMATTVSDTNHKMEETHGGVQETRTAGCGGGRPSRTEDRGRARRGRLAE
jgi:GntR family transcriptional repressor for pyruvate dehydrogenase complex